MRRMRTVLALACMFGPIFICGVTSGDLLLNGNFETVGSNGSQTFFDGQGGGGPSAAADWGIFHFSQGSTETNLLAYDELLLPPIFPGQETETDHVLRVETNGINNGVVQVFGAPNTGPVSAEGSIWIYVNGPGQVGVGLGNGGLTQTTSLTTQTNAWEEIIFSNNTSPANEITIYNVGTSAEFYVDFARVTAVPEPTSALLLCSLGFLGVLRRRRRLMV